MTRRYLVTGAQGFLGRYLTAELLREDGDRRVLGIGRSPRSDAHFTHTLAWTGAPVPAPLPAALRTAARDPRYRYQAVDVEDAGAVARAVAEFRPHVVFHLASALRGEPRERLYRTNLGGTRGLLAGIAAARALPVVRARIFNLVGPGQDEWHAAGRFAGRLAALARAGLPRRLEVGSLSPTRDWMDVRDAAAALALLGERGRPGRAYNVASGVEVPVRDVLDALVRLAGAPVDVVEDRAGAPPGDPRHVADVRRLRELGFVPAHPLGRTLADLWDYYLGVDRHAVSDAA